MSYYYYFMDGEVRCVETGNKRAIEKDLGAVLYKDKAEAERIKEKWENDRIINIRKELVAVYEDWFNNFVTIPAFADYYGLSEEESKQVIELGKKIYERRIKDKS